MFYYVKNSNGLGYEGAKEISKLLLTNKSLTELKLGVIIIKINYLILSIIY